MTSALSKVEILTVLSYCNYKDFFCLGPYCKANHDKLENLLIPRELKNRTPLSMFWLIYVMMNIQNVLLWLECRHGDVCATDQFHRQ